MHPSINLSLGLYVNYMHTHITYIHTKHGKRVFLLRFFLPRGRASLMLSFFAVRCLRVARAGLPSRKTTPGRLFLLAAQPPGTAHSITQAGTLGRGHPAKKNTGARSWFAARPPRTAHSLTQAGPLGRCHPGKKRPGCVHGFAAWALTAHSPTHRAKNNT